MTLQSILAMAWRTVTNPREGAEEVLSLGVPREALWTLLLLVVVLSILFGQLTAILATPAMAPDAAGMMMSPIGFGVLQLGLLLATIYAIYFIGRGFGGTGSLAETMLLMAWLQFIMVCLQAVIIGFLLILPPLADMLSIFGLFLFMWLLTNFVAVIHGFRSLGQVFLVIIMAMFGAALVLSILLTAFGLVPEGGVI